jgi:hypothetical protein
MSIPLEQLLIAGNAFTGIVLVFNPLLGIILLLLVILVEALICRSLDRSNNWFIFATSSIVNTATAIIGGVIIFSIFKSIEVLSLTNVYSDISRVLFLIVLFIISLAVEYYIAGHLPSRFTRPSDIAIMAANLSSTIFILTIIGPLSFLMGVY